jgi:predicted membrane protein
MHRFRHSIVAILAALTLLFNVERLDLGEVNAVDISSFVYALAFLMVSGGLTLALPPPGRRWLGAIAGFWLAAYLFGKLFLFHDRPF